MRDDEVQNITIVMKKLGTKILQGYLKVRQVTSSCGSEQLEKQTNVIWMMTEVVQKYFAKEFGLLPM